MDVVAPQPVALFKPQRVEGAAARRDDAERLARPPQDVPQLRPLLDRRIYLPAELTDV